MLLENETAVIYGAAGAIGAAVARAYAREGARLFLTGRHHQPLADLARTIDHHHDEPPEVAALDAQDPASVRAHAATVADAAGGIDIAFNATSNDDVQGTPLADMALDDVLRPVAKAVTTHLVIATAVAHHMTARRRGVILAMGGGREAIPDLGGSHIAWSALAGLCRQLASELGPAGIRVVWLLSPGSPDDTSEPTAGDPDAGATILKRRPRLDDVGNVAAFLASDWATTMTATEVNITAGAVVD